MFFKKKDEIPKIGEPVEVEGDWSAGYTGFGGVVRGYVISQEGIDEVVVCTEREKPLKTIEDIRKHCETIPLSSFHEDEDIHYGKEVVEYIKEEHRLGLEEWHDWLKARQRMLEALVHGKEVDVSEEEKEDLLETLKTQGITPKEALKFIKRHDLRLEIEHTIRKIKNKITGKRWRE